MNEFTGKICPYCRTEIKEGEAVKVCPECGIPHHESCWEENKGCTTFGCKEQHYEANNENTEYVCKNCGASVGEGQNFCPKCGSPVEQKKEKVCSVCGRVLDEDQLFCPGCGSAVTPAEAGPSAEAEPDAVPEAAVCRVCGEKLQSGQEFCPKCGTKVPPAGSRICSKCGTVMDKDQEFCPKCGQKSDLYIAPDVNNAINEFNSKLAKTVKKKDKTFIINTIAGGLFIALLFVDGFFSYDFYLRLYTSDTTTINESFFFLMENNSFLQAVCGFLAIAPVAFLIIYSWIEHFAKKPLKIQKHSKIISLVCAVVPFISLVAGTIGGKATFNSRNSIYLSEYGTSVATSHTFDNLNVVFYLELLIALAMIVLYIVKNKDSFKGMKKIKIDINIK